MSLWKKQLTTIGLAVTLFAGMLTGCANPAGQQSSGSNTGTTNNTTANATVEDGPTVLTVLSEQNNGWNKNFNPFIQGAYHMVQGFMYEPLVIFDSYTKEEVMWLAESIVSEEDNRTLTVNLRQDVLWSDGEKFDADDVVFTFTYTKDNPAIDRSGDWSGEDGVGKIESVTKIDDYTVEIVMTEENRFHRSTVFANRWMAPEHIWSSVSDPDNYIYDVDQVVVTGAFSEVLSYAPEIIALGRNENYWKADDLEVDEMHWPQYNSNDAALAMLQTGSIDWAHMFIPNIEETYVKGDENRKYWYGRFDSLRLSTNFQTPDEGNNEAFNDPEFKKAMSMAIDRVGIINSAVHGYLSTDVPSNSGVPANLTNYLNDEAQEMLEPWVEYNLDGAREILADAGYVDLDGDGFVETPSGLTIDFDIISPAGWTDWNDAASICSEGMQAIGINGSANAKDLSLVTQHWAAGDWDVMYSAYGTSSDIYRFYFDTIADSSRAKTDTWWSVCQTNYINEELSELIGTLPTAQSDEEVQEIVNKVELFMTENMINIPMYYQGNWFVYNDSRFTGWSETEEQGQPANAVHDSKILQLLRLEAVD